MRGISSFLAACVITTTIVYGLGVFIALEPDVTAWTKEGRMFFLLFSFGSWVLMAVAKWGPKQ